ncbi:MAG: phage tail sheath C-terminal domain-containing protein, partial [Verrucomicrobiota bacterium]
PAEAWQSLQDAQLNFLRQDPGGFRCLAADTLSSDPELHPINVRRLLHLLRRAALRLGATYVFEPMNDAFIRTVHHAFENLMLHLFARGALAGRSPADSFQVNTGPSVNPPESRELGRFIVEIKVAPALPLRFLTLRLVQTGDRATVSETQ